MKLTQPIPNTFNPATASPVRAGLSRRAARPVVFDRFKRRMILPLLGDRAGVRAVVTQTNPERVPEGQP